MKKLLAMLLALVLVLSLAACGGGGTTTSDPVSGSASSTPVEPTETKKTVNGSPDDEKTWIYEIVETGLQVREFTVDSGKGGEPVEIVQISDMHFNAINDKDRQENNPTIMGNGSDKGMYEYRVNLKDGAIRPNAEICLNYAKNYDQTVVTGDSIDYLTWGAIEMVNDVIWGAIPDALVGLGNHDMVRGWTEAFAAGVPTDTSFLESRYQILQDNWKHDIYYTSKVVGDKAMVIQLDNGSGTFWDSQVSKLKADIATAREKGYVVLLFTHIALSNNNPSQPGAPVIDSGNGKKGVSAYKPSGLNETAATKAIYDVVFNNADVIRGVFSGHNHKNVYYDIAAKTPSGEAKTIPQVILTSIQYEKGTVMKITVK